MPQTTAPPRLPEAASRFDHATRHVAVIGRLEVGA